jgi:hypothetical protein
LLHSEFRDARIRHLNKAQVNINFSFIISKTSQIPNVESRTYEFPHGTHVEGELIEDATTTNKP